MAAKGLATVLLSVTTLDGELARTLEPRASTPHKRLAAIQALARAGVPTGVMAAPMIPALNDSELENILAAARDAGAARANFTLLRLPLEIKELFTEWLETHAPNRAKHVLSLIRQSRGGKLNDANFHSRFVGSGAYADMMARRFRIACRRLELNKTPLTLDTTQFRLPPRAGDQLALI
jgi:DNA repair photolyase